TINQIIPRNLPMGNNTDACVNTMLNLDNTETAANTSPLHITHLGKNRARPAVTDIPAINKPDNTTPPVPPVLTASSCTALVAAGSVVTKGCDNIHVHKPEMARKTAAARPPKTAMFNPPRCAPSPLKRLAINAV